MREIIIKWSNLSNSSEFVSSIAGAVELPDGLTELDIMALETVEDSLYMFTKDAMYQLCDKNGGIVFVRVI